MSNMVLKDSNNFQEVISKFDLSISHIQEVFDNEDKNFDKVNNSGIWEGNLKEEIVNKYKELSSTYGGIIDSLNELSEFMKKSLTEYKEFESTVNNNVDVNLDNLNVNS